MITYDYSANLHTPEGAKAGISVIKETLEFRSLLDVGTGVGTWLRAALDQGIDDVVGVDTDQVRGRRLLVPPDLVQTLDLREDFDLERRFDLVLCLEVAEHLPAESSQVLIQSLCRHGDTVIFSAACPGQHGYKHINCHWPEHWQGLFNSMGYLCDDGLRTRIWTETSIEPWYRQNIFVARRGPGAGTEPRLRKLIHPDMVQYLDGLPTREGRELRDYIAGRKPPRFYGRPVLRSLARTLGLPGADG